MPLDDTNALLSLPEQESQEALTLEEELVALAVDYCAPHRHKDGSWTWRAQPDTSIIKLVINIFSRRRLFIAQNAHEAPPSMEVRVKRGNNVFFTPHGAVDYFVQVGIYRRKYALFRRSTAYNCGCEKVFTAGDVKFMLMLERQHNKIHALRRRAMFEEEELNALVAGWSPPPKLPAGMSKVWDETLPRSGGKSG